MGAAWLSGFRLYGTLLTLGLLERLHLAHLPGALSFLSKSWVHWLAGFLFLIEFAADTIPAVDAV